MGIEKIISVDRIEILVDGRIAVRTKSAFIENLNEVAATFEVRLIAPGDDYSAEDAKVQSICAAVHTPEVVVAYEAAQEAAQVPLDAPAV
jgi:hypothetical protein